MIFPAGPISLGFGLGGRLPRSGRLRLSMTKHLLVIVVLIGCLSPQEGRGQVDGGQLGSWYMYFWDVDIDNTQWGFQGDFQHRSWDVPGDLEQRLLRGGITYKLTDTKLKFTLGYAHILSGEFGPSDDVSNESRIYQELLFPQKLGTRFYFNHRFRFEQRFADNQDFRTRYRYNLFLNIPLNKMEIVEGAVYLAFYNELFINGQKDIGSGESVGLFDRNRIYGGMGYAIKDQFKVQLAYMRQTTDDWDKGQLQFSIHHKF